MKNSSRKFRRWTYKDSLRTWYEDKSPVLRFGLKFCVLTVALYAVTLLPQFAHTVDFFINGSAKVTSAILNGMGESSRVSEGTIYSAYFGLTILPACTCIDLFCFYSAALLAFPARWTTRIIGIVVGVLFLHLLNITRVMSLYLIGMHFPTAFDVVHESLWGFILIPATLYLGLTWARWARHHDRLELSPTA